MINSPKWQKLPQHNEKGEPYPWKDEPNFAYYTDEDSGLDYFINRHYEMGFLCGYVVVEKDDLPLLRPKTDLCGDPDDQFEAHGGATFCDKFDWQFFKKLPVYCIGFDCGHGWDLLPFCFIEEFNFIYSPESRKFKLENDVYRDIKYVQNECKKLAKQVADYLKNHKKEENS